MFMKWKIILSVYLHSYFPLFLQFYFRFYIVIALTALLTSYMYQKNGMSEGHYEMSIWIISCLIFVYVISLGFSKEHAILKWIGSCTFGIYLIEDIIRNRLEFLIPILRGYVTEIGAVYVFVLSVFLVSLCLISIGKKIPVIRFFLR